MFINFNPNPLRKRVDDCAIRAISKALNVSWDTAFDKLSYVAKSVGDLQNSNTVIDIVLRSNDFVRYIIPNTCPICYTAKDFCEEHKNGVFVLCFGSHVATVVDGNLYDSWDSSAMMPLYYYRKDY